ncbi:protein FAM149B1-like isoform X2 [Babylonia areolata]|uniref:protein FAM149B1-like isoform X2 n=1 Tax=Babylonia areolata TaxID=304850 RepID=UPI003FD116C4
MTSRHVRKTVPLEIRAVQRAGTQQQQQNAPLPEAVDEDLPSDYVATVHRAINSYNKTSSIPASSGRSSPANGEVQSSVAVSRGGWTTGNTTERSSVYSSCYSLDEFDRQAASTVNQHFEEFESMLFEGPRETQGSSVYRECQEWVTQFPHLRVLGQQLMAPTDMGYDFVSSDSCARLSTPGTLDFSLIEHDESTSSDVLGLSLSGQKLRASLAPVEGKMGLAPLPRGLTPGPQSRSNYSYGSDEYSFLHEEIFAQDGIYEDIIAVDYKDISEENLEHHKKKISLHRRHVGYPPITPNACVKDSILSGAFDGLWSEVMSWLRTLLRRCSVELEADKKSSLCLDHVLAPQRPVRASSFVLTPRDAPDGMPSFLHVSKMALRDRNSHSMSSVEMGESAILGESSHAAFMPMQQIMATRPSTMHHPRRRLSHNQHLDPLREPSKILSTEEGRTPQPSPQNALRVKQIVPSSSHRLSSPPTSMPGRLPPLESSSGLPSHRKFGHRASSAIDNKEGRKQGGRERNSSSTEVSRPSTTQAFRSDTPFGAHNPLVQSIPARQVYVMGGNSGGLNVLGNGLYPSADPVSSSLEDHEGPSVDRHNQWIPSAPSFSFFKPRRTLRN